MSHVLVVEQLRKVYGKKKPFLAVGGISFHLKAGEILGFLGPNGSGKTTTIQMLLGTLSLTSGSIRYFGKEFPRYRSEILQSVSFASTYTSLPAALTIEENLKCFGLFYGLDEAEKRSAPLLERFGLYEKRHQPVGALSAGQLTRLTIVKAFFTKPKIVLLDEPTASLDPDVSREVCKFLLEQREQLGVSILFTSHKMEEVAQLCDRTIFLKDGKIIADDVPQNLAKSVSTFELRLTIVDGMKRTQSLAEKRKLKYTIDQRRIEIALDEKEIPPFLSALVHADISYTAIQIKEPSLEDYFLKIAEKKG
ncbi:MAG: ABC transporter ATP-binding protein [Chlamydiia bacterium]|nr:ABC transporter ATP-binding protein [Chlamydiia bacterium]